MIKSWDKLNKSLVICATSWRLCESGGVLVENDHTVMGPQLYFSRESVVQTAVSAVAKARRKTDQIELSCAVLCDPT